MLDINSFSINTYEKDSLPTARRLGFALEVEEYLWMYSEDEITQKRRLVSEMADGFTKKSFHGTAVSRDINYINVLSDDELLAVYNESYGFASFHGIEKIVFHSNFVNGHQPDWEWINRKTEFWMRFLKDKPELVKVYVENLADDNPETLARLCDAVGDQRFKICLDIGHASCNSKIPLKDWISVLGKRIEHVHLHNNDGISDKHWALGRGVIDFAEVLEQLAADANVETYVLECDFNSSVQWLDKNNFIKIGG